MSFLLGRSGRIQFYCNQVECSKNDILLRADRLNAIKLYVQLLLIQNAFTNIDAETGAITYRGDIIDAQVDEWTPGCPSSNPSTSIGSTFSPPTFSISL